MLIVLLALTACSAQVAPEAPVPDPAVPSSYDKSYSADEFFIAGVKMGWSGALPSNTELVRLGKEACKNQSEPKNSNAERVMTYAKAVYCP